MGWTARSDWQMAGDGGTGPCLPGRLLLTLEFQQVRGTGWRFLPCWEWKEFVISGSAFLPFSNAYRSSGSSLSRLVSNQRPNSHDFSFSDIFPWQLLRTFDVATATVSPLHTPKERRRQTTDDLSTLLHTPIEVWVESSSSNSTHVSPPDTAAVQLFPRLSLPLHVHGPTIRSARNPSSGFLDIPRWHRSSTWPRPLEISEMDVSLRLRASGLHHGRHGTRPSLVYRCPLLPPPPPLPPREHNAVSHRTAMSHCLHPPREAFHPSSLLHLRPHHFRDTCLGAAATPRS